MSKFRIIIIVISNYKWAMVSFQLKSRSHRTINWDDIFKSYIDVGYFGIASNEISDINEHIIETQKIPLLH